MLAYRIACEAPGLLAAIGPVGGTMVCECPRPEPVSVLHIHGLEDRNAPYWGAGGPKAFDRRPRPAVPSVIDLWRQAAACGPAAVTELGQVRRETAVSPRASGSTSSPSPASATSGRVSASLAEGLGDAQPRSP